jgi:hypothetical protein
MTMPVEIKELVIRASVSTKEARGCCGDDSDGDEETEGHPTAPEVDSAAIVRTTVAEVLRILKASKER